MSSPSTKASTSSSSPPTKVARTPSSWRHRRPRLAWYSLFALGLLIVLTLWIQIKETNQVFHRSIDTGMRLPFLSNNNQNPMSAITTIQPPQDGNNNILLHHDTNNHQHATFGNALTTRLNWTVYDQIVSNRTNTAGLLEFAQQVYQVAFAFAITEPYTPIDTTCGPQRLPPVTSSQCSADVSNAFTGKVRNHPRKVGHAVQFGFDVDTLEILLRELIDVVDVFFVVEWTLPHNRRLKPKPLGWEAIKHQPRFAFCKEKVVHIILDDVDATNINTKNGWGAEDYQETKRWQKIVAWNDRTNFFGDDDLIGFGDVDEIPNRKNIHYLKYCEWSRPLEVDVGIWFPMGRINQAFKTDYPIGTFRYSLGDPTYHTFQAAQESFKARKKAPTRNRGTSFYWIFGGAHFSHYGYLVYQVLKQMSCTECDESNFQQVFSKLRSAVETGKWQELELEASQPLPNWKKRIIPLASMHQEQREKIVYLPWFYDCNRDRFSMWEGRPDSRTA